MGLIIPLSGVAFFVIGFGFGGWAWGWLVFLSIPIVGPLMCLLDR